MAIHEQNYVSYDGPLKQGRGWWIFARTTFRMAMGFKRTWFLLIASWIPVIITLGLVFVEYGIRQNLSQAMNAGAGDFGTSAVGLVLQMFFFSAALLMMAIGCRTISEDLRYRTFQLYFSRPVERWEYILGKFVGNFMLCSLVTIVPAVLIGGVRALYFARTDFASQVFRQTAVGLGIALLMAVVITSVVLGLSSLTRRSGYAVLAWIGILFVPLVITVIVNVTNSSPDAAALLNLPGNFSLLTKLLLAKSPPDVPLIAPILVLVGLSALSLFGVRWRINKLEGIA